MKSETQKGSFLLNSWFLPLTGAFISSVGFSYYLDFSTKNPFTIFFFVILLLVYQKRMNVKDKRINIISFCLSLIFTAFMLLNKISEIYDDVGSVVTPDRYASMIFGFICFFFVVFGLLFEACEKICFIYSSKESSVKKQVLAFAGTTILLFLFWLPFFILRFPGELTNDSLNQLLIITGVYPKSNHHPYAHTMLIKLLYNAGLKIFGNSPEYGIATYSIVQMLLMAMAYAYFIASLFKFKVRKGVIAAALLIYMFPGYNIDYSFTMWKDILFSGFVLVYSTAMWRYAIKGKDEKNTYELIILLFSGIGICLFRSNGLYAFAMLFVFAAVYCIRHREFKLLSVTAVSLIVSIIVHGPIYSSLGIKQPDPIESLSIPAQQIAAVVTENRSLTESEKELLSHVADLEIVPEVYTNYTSDPIKALVRITGDQDYLVSHKKEFFQLWIDLGRKYPLSYVNSYIQQTKGYWYPDNFLWAYANQSGISEEFVYIPDHKPSPGIDEALDNIWNSHTEMPFLGMLWSCGFFTWTMLIAAAISVIKKQKTQLLIYVLPVGIIGTLLIATPVYCEFRYVYSIIITAPLYCIVPFVKSKE